MEKKRVGIGLVLACVLALGLSPGVRAETECDTDPGAVFYQATVNPALLNAVLNLLGEIPLRLTFDLPFSILFNHTLHLNLDTGINIGGVQFLVETDVGEISVTLSLPAWGTALTITVSHAPCFAPPYASCEEQLAGCSLNCGQDLVACNDVCDSTWDVCVAGCEAAHTACTTPCEEDYGSCMAGCAPGSAGDLCRLGCELVRGVCTADCDLEKGACLDQLWAPVGCNPARDNCRLACGVGELECGVGCVAQYTACGPCLLEAAAIDLLLGENPVNIGFTSASLEQRADVCVNASCAAIHPLESTEMTVNGLYVELFPPDPLGDFLNQVISAVLDTYLVSILDEIESFFEVDGEGVLIQPFSHDLRHNGCAPVPEVLECLGNNCSVAAPLGQPPARGASALLYFLPVAVMIGLIVWRRRR